MKEIIFQALPQLFTLDTRAEWQSGHYRSDSIYI